MAAPKPSDDPQTETPTNGTSANGSAPAAEAALPRDAANWAQGVTTLRIAEAPEGAITINVNGRRIVGPLQGFGQMWQKTYRVRLVGASVDPLTVVRTWKEHFAEFWPPRNRFYGPLTGIAPGEVAVLNITVSGMPLSTGVLVLYADDESFTLMTPQGHVFAGWITFSSFVDPSDGVTVAQAQVLMRANDPIYELGLRFGGGHRQEDLFWQHTLRSLAAHFGVEAPVVMERVCVDRRVQWREARNIWMNSAVRTVLYVLASPFRWLTRRRAPAR